MCSKQWTRVNSTNSVKNPALKHSKTYSQYEQTILHWCSCVCLPEEGVVRQTTMSFLNRMCQLWNMSWYIIHYVCRLETPPPRIIWWESTLHRLLFFGGSAIYWELSLRELCTIAPRHALKSNDTVSKYVQSTRPDRVGVF